MKPLDTGKQIAKTLKSEIPPPENMMTHIRQAAAAIAKWWRPYDIACGN